MNQTTPQLDQRQGLAFLSIGLRPFFLLATLWAASAMVLWLAMITGHLTLPTRFDPVSWHAHEFLFGYVGAVLAGFLLTAVPNWTGGAPLKGARLAGLALLWAIGRLAVAVSVGLPVAAVIIADLAFMVVLLLVILNAIAASKNWQNLPVVALIGVVILANLMFHLDAAGGDVAAYGVGLRLGLGSILLLVTLIGGRIIPSFTRNWLVKRGETELPASPMQRFDKVAIVFTILAFLGWSVAPLAIVSGAALILIAALHTVRLWRWKGYLTTSEPLVWVLHVAYGFVPLGAALNGVAILTPDVMSPATALHVWMAGAIGLMTVAVMTRAALGHTGQTLRAGMTTTLLYLSLILSVFARAAADLLPVFYDTLLYVSAILWIGCFAGFVLRYGPLLIRAKTGSPA